VLLFHAGVTDRRSWAPLVEALGPGHSTIDFDRRGFGETRYQPEPHSHENDALAVLDATGAGSAPVAAVGASMGGQAALELAHPERVAALVLIGSAVRGAPHTDHAELPQPERRLSEAIEAAEATGDLDAVNRLEAQRRLDGPTAPEGRVSGATRELFLAMNGTALTAADPGPQIQVPAAWDRLTDVAAPTLVLVGDLDIVDCQTPRRRAGRTHPRRPPRGPAPHRPPAPPRGPPRLPGSHHHFPLRSLSRPRPSYGHKIHPPVCGQVPIGRSVVAGGASDERRGAARCSAPRRDSPDVLAQMICARVLARSAYSQGARDRQFWRGVGGAVVWRASTPDQSTLRLAYTYRPLMEIEIGVESKNDSVAVSEQNPPPSGKKTQPLPSEWCAKTPVMTAGPPWKGPSPASGSTGTTNVCPVPSHVKNDGAPGNENAAPRLPVPVVMSRPLACWTVTLTKSPIASVSPRLSHTTVTGTLTTTRSCSVIGSPGVAVMPGAALADAPPASNTAEAVSATTTTRMNPLRIVPPFPSRERTSRTPRRGVCRMQKMS
jgi:pimeloyl-ACP methyl ester carboxylesterase